LARTGWWYIEPDSSRRWPQSNSVATFARLGKAIEVRDSKAADELLPLVYAELRKLAAAKMAQEAPGNTL